MPIIEVLKRACRIQATPSEKLYLALLIGAMEHGEEITLARVQAKGYLNFSKGTISKLNGRLKRRGLLDVIPQYNEYGGRMPNKYRLKLGK